jgi:DNA-directed RNA polymerase specialized sigma24 family protein
MFDESSDLSPDLEWMLQSRQVDDETLIEALTHQYYQPFYRLALSQLTYPEEAHRAAQETLIEAVFQGRNYRGETIIDEWLLNILSGICYQRNSNLEKYRFLNPKLIRSILSNHPIENLTQLQTERAILKMNAQLLAKRTAKSKQLSYQVLGLIVLVILTALTLFQLIDIAPPP